MTNDLEVPVSVRVFDSLARRLLRWGLPMGPNRMLTIRGRRTGQPRQAAVAVVAVNGQRWVVGTFGEVNWVRNLRAAGQAVLHDRRGDLRVRAVELNQEEAADFFGGPLRVYVDGLPWAARRWVPDEVLADPAGAARNRPVFELIVLRDEPGATGGRINIRS